MIIKNYLKLAINLIKLTRLNKPIGIYLLLIPTICGLIIAKNSQQIIWLIFIFGALIMRSSGCIINDIFDQKFDKNTNRTKERPLASGLLTTKQAIILLFILLTIGLILLLQLNQKTILYGVVIILPMIILYPLTKRIMPYPQFFLAIVFNSPFLLALTASNLAIEKIHFTFYLSLLIWTVIYDTIYGFQDLQDDLQNKVQSFAIKIYGKEKRVLLFLNLIQWLLLLLPPYFFNIDSNKKMLIFYFPLIIVATIISSAIIRKTNFNDVKSCGVAFLQQKIIGALYLLIFAVYSL